MAKRVRTLPLHAPFWQVAWAIVAIAAAILGPAFVLQARIDQLTDVQATNVQRIIALEKSQAQQNQQLANMSTAAVSAQETNVRLAVEICGLIEQTNLEHATESRDKALLWSKVFNQPYPPTLYFPDCQPQTVAEQK